MSKISEYLSLIPLGLKNREAIFDGLVNVVRMNFNTLPIEEQDEIIRRRAICLSCPLMSENAKSSKEYVDLTGGNYSTDRVDEHCSLCACNIYTKTASLESFCGALSFNEARNGKQIAEVKWVNFK